MRLVPLSLTLLLLAGCGRLVGMNSARRDATREALVSQRFPMRPDEAALRVRTMQGITSRCDWMSGELKCGGCTHGRCFQFADESGYTRVIPQDELSESDLMSIWQGLDRRSLDSYRLVQQDLVLDQLVKQEEEFEPRFGITGGFVAGLSTASSSLSTVALGGRLGVRRWFDIHFIGHAAIEYRFLSASGTGSNHELAARVGLELARWTEGRLWGSVGAPGASIAMFIGPVLRLPTADVGIRTGVGVHLTDVRSAPFFVEAAADTSFAGEASRVTGTFTIGVGL